LSAIQTGVYHVKEVINGVKGAAEDTYRVDKERCLQRDFIANRDGNKFIYAVTQTATQPGFDPFDPNAGRIDVQNAARTDATANDQVYVLVDTGENARGAFHLDGQQRVACGVPADGLDQENCNNDAIFISAQTVINDGASYYDDRIDFGVAGFISEETMWRWGQEIGSTRDMILGNNARLVIDSADALASTPVTDDDALVVNRGRMRIERSLLLRSKEHPADGVKGGRLRTQNDILVRDPDPLAGNRGGITNVDNPITAPRYCYGNGENLVNDCASP
jgi:hypothetical protein